MNTTMKTSKDNVMLSALVVAGLAMITIGSAMANAETQTVMASASSIVHAVATPTPTAMQPILYREAAIIVSAQRLQDNA
ncbi:MAG: hypothetical protein ABI905_15395 [Betaproteobacteria bacterium]